MCILMNPNQETISEVSGVLILTLRMDEQAQQFFNLLRERHFPAERNFLKAHLTLFHKLPDNDYTLRYLNTFKRASFDMEVTTLINIGAGVAYRLEGEQLKSLRAVLSKEFMDVLSPQDRQGFRGHVTVQNKTSPEAARTLLAKLTQDFTPFTVKALGLDVWEYLGGPWQHRVFLEFDK